MSDAGDFIDGALQNESSWQRAEEAQARFGPELKCYGASVGAVRGTVRDALRRYRILGRDELTALSSELWAVPVFERRLAAVVLLQSCVAMLDNSDLTRIEGFVRGSGFRELADPLAVDVVGPLIAGLDGARRSRSEAVLERWRKDPDPRLRRSAALVREAIDAASGLASPKRSRPG
ncbi:DNA alkylation repair protein [Arthrobacter sp. UYEF3]|uniref:DNA alkylation repair protein n=1 Tax=Arthrobacter sp. UYEF3 TaxID=1756365 RepID=UPI0033946998